ncbi:Glycoside hydrolase family 76 protein [Mycena indigotica]|uniref:Glycoside hydrolase family 76 protein n=1 Tax=Mycena indigotica TaxID=2126181 RepID=A0A8H6S4I1_9AGAR|nr:Glycoside hydrolase family 76 protein [Mycena indigotica]KAF7292193.1 Glycoside hydrolase family 76 protein [Mycena indigotica]
MLPFVFVALSMVVVPVVRAGIAASSWREPSFIYANTPRTHQAFAALIQAMSVLHTPNLKYDGQNYEWFAHVMGQMAESDFIGNGTAPSTSYEAALADYFRLTVKDRPSFQDQNVDYALAWGYAAARAYFTLNNATFLSYAVQSWEWANTLTIPAATTKLGSKAPVMAATCSNVSMAGGTFASSAASSALVSARSTAYFSLLSAMLAQATSNATYLTAAVSSATFIYTQLWDTQNSVPFTSLAADSCAVVDASLNSYNAGLLIEALSVMSAITGKDERVGKLVDALIISVLGYGGWQTGQGILANGADKLGDGLLARALAWAYVYDAPTAGTKGYAHDYLAVQYNALLELATSNTTTPAAGATSNATNIYAGQWTGPPPAPQAAVSFANQTNAVNLLYAASWIDFPRSPAPPTVTLALDNGAFIFPTQSQGPGGSPSPPAIKSPKPTSHIGVIVGVIIGALVGLAAITGVLYNCLRRRARRNTGRRSEDPQSPSYIRPFTDRRWYSDEHDPDTTSLMGPGVVPPTPCPIHDLYASGDRLSASHGRTHSHGTSDVPDSRSSSTLSASCPHCVYQQQHAARPASGWLRKSAAAPVLAPVRRQSSAQTHEVQRRGVSFADGMDVEEPPPQYA